MLKLLPILNTFLNGNLKDCLRKVINLFLRLITNSLIPLIDYYGYNIRVKFNGSILRQPKVSYTHKKAVNIYIVYKLAGSNPHSEYPTLKNCLFGVVTLTKNADKDKYGYSGYGIGFDRKSIFSFPGSGFGQNVIIFGVDMSSSVHVDNLEKDQHKGQNIH